MKIATEDTRRRALAACRARRGSQAQIAAMFGVTLRTVQRWWRQFRQAGTSAPQPRGHRRAAIDGPALRKLEQAVRERPDATLAELRVTLGQTCSLMAVQRARVRLDLRYKKNAAGQRARTPRRQTSA